MLLKLKESIHLVRLGKLLDLHESQTFVRINVIFALLVSYRTKLQFVLNEAFH